MTREVDGRTLTDHGDGSIPSAMAFSRSGEAVFIGEAALSAPPEDYDLLLNWKLLLGKSTAELLRETTENEALSRILSRLSLDRIAVTFFGALIKLVREKTAAAENPHVIIGVPAVADTTSDWRHRYKRTMEKAFAQLLLPAPSALTHSADSQEARKLRVCADGTDGMRVVERSGQKAVGSDCIGSQPAA